MRPDGGGSAPAGPVEPVRIDRIAAGGDGVGRLPDGRVVFVPRTAPGDRIECRITRSSARFARGRIGRLLEPGPERIEPPCRHYRDDECGGCQLQHLATGAQRAARRAVAGDALRRIGRLAVDDPPLVAGEREWGYRSKITLSRGPDGSIGYHRLERPGQIVPLRTCPIAAAEVNALWERVRGAGKLPRELERLTLRRDRSGGEHVILETGEGRPWAGGRELHRAAAGERPLTVWWRPAGGAARAVAGADSAYPATAFEQINPEMGDRARHRAVEGLGDVAGLLAWDLYAGIGEASDLLARGGARVQAVERDGSAVAEAERRQLVFGRQIERVAGPVERVVRSLERPDVVIVNPPRTGLVPEAAEAVLAAKPRRIGYVSCDPATLARDLVRLGVGSGGYRLESLEAFDLFPQTAHVETVAVLERA
ncbi:MAG: class I SAM-dependent RNA methyltransferase [Gemmatimonadales bacterium]